MVKNAPVLPRFTLEDSVKAGEDWGFNCGPAALCMVAGRTPNEIRPFLGGFESKGYTNPTLMFECLNRLGIRWKPSKARGSTAWFPDGLDLWPSFGLCRVQWEGPWTAPGVPIRVRYRHTHWIGCMRIDNGEPGIFDVNCMSVGGWVSFSVWRDQVVPWILRECQPKANGGWHLTHVLQCERPD